MIFFNRLQNKQWSPFNANNSFPCWRFNNCSNVFGNWIKWMKLNNLVLVNVLFARG